MISELSHVIGAIEGLDVDVDEGEGGGMGALEVFFGRGGGLR